MKSKEFLFIIVILWIGMFWGCENNVAETVENDSIEVLDVVEIEDEDILFVDRDEVLKDIEYETPETEEDSAYEMLIIATQELYNFEKDMLEMNANLQEIDASFFGLYETEIATIDHLPEISNALFETRIKAEKANYYVFGYKLSKVKELVSNAIEKDIAINGIYAQNMIEQIDSYLNDIYLSLEILDTSVDYFQEMRKYLKLAKEADEEENVVDFNKYAEIAIKSHAFGIDSLVYYDSTKYILDQDVSNIYFLASIIQPTEENVMRYLGIGGYTFNERNLDAAQVIVKSGIDIMSYEFSYEIMDYIFTYSDDIDLITAVAENIKDINNPIFVDYVEEFSSRDIHREALVVLISNGFGVYHDFVLKRLENTSDEEIGLKIVDNMSTFFIKDVEDSIFSSYHAIVFDTNNSEVEAALAQKITEKIHSSIASSNSTYYQGDVYNQPALDDLIRIIYTRDANKIEESMYDWSDFHDLWFRTHEMRVTGENEDYFIDQLKRSLSNGVVMTSEYTAVAPQVTLERELKEDEVVLYPYMLNPVIVFEDIDVESEVLAVRDDFEIVTILNYYNGNVIVNDTEYTIPFANVVLQDGTNGYVLTDSIYIPGQDNILEFIYDENEDEWKILKFIMYWMY